MTRRRCLLRDRADTAPESRTTVTRDDGVSPPGRTLVPPTRQPPPARRGTPGRVRRRVTRGTCRVRRAWPAGPVRPRPRAGRAERRSGRPSWPACGGHPKGRCSPVPCAQNTHSGESAAEELERRYVACVVVLSGLDDERDAARGPGGEQRSERFQADSAAADATVPIAFRAGGVAAVVHVHEPDPTAPDRPAKRGECAGHPGTSREVVPGGVQVAGVEADADPLVVQ